VLGGPLAHVLEVGGELHGGHEVVLLQHQLGLGLEAPRIGVRVPGLARPDLGAVLIHLPGHAHHGAERLDAGHVEDDPVAGLHLLGHAAPAFLHADHAETVLAGGAEVVERAREDPGGRGHRKQRTGACHVVSSATWKRPRTS
jgi:hypothetical protein